MAEPYRYLACGQGPGHLSGVWRLDSMPGVVDRILTLLGGDPLAPFILSFQGRRRIFLPHMRCGRKKIRWLAKRANLEVRMQALSCNPFFSLLSSDVRLKLCQLSADELQRSIQCYLAIEDCLVLSSPESFGMAKDGYRPITKLWKWCWSTLAHHNGVSNLNRMWKSLTSHVKALAIKSEEPLPPVVPGTIFWNQKEGKLDLSILLGTPLAWLERICRRGLQTKSEGTRLMHFISTRGTPAPTKLELGDALIEHGEILCGKRDFQVKPERISILRKLGVRLGRFAAKNAGGRQSIAHLSLTNSASFTGPRSGGGRAASFGKAFALWANTESKLSLDKMTIFGQNYSVRQGVKIFRTMCRKTIAADGDLIESDNTFDVDVDFENFVFEDRIHGLDSYTGYQMLQFALEEGIRSGCISGDPWYSPGKPHKVVGAPSIKVSPVGEPGGKCRTITVGEDWVTQLLSPFGHELISLVEQIPSARAGLSAAAMAYEYVKRLQRKKGIDSCQELCFLTSDLTQASEYLEHEYSEALLKGFIDGAGLSSPYMTLATELLCSPRYIEGVSGNGFPYPRSGHLTVRASLMGDPGTKAALMLTMLASEEEAYLTYVGSTLDPPVSFQEMLLREEPETPWRCFAAAGDDHVAVGPREYLRLIKSTIVENGGVVSQTKSFVSTIGTYFTEELLLKTGESHIEDERLLWNIPYNETIHVDSLKVRLLSPCSIVTMVREEKNPALGKGQFFAKKLNWLPTQWLVTKDLFLRRFYLRFHKFLDLGLALTYLPRFTGGIGLPIPNSIRDSELVDMVMKLPPIVRAAIADQLLSQEEYHVRNALWAFASNTTYRGINMRTMAEEQLKAVFTHFVSDSVHSSQLQDHLGVEPERWLSMRSRDKSRLAKSRGLTSLKEAVQLFERPTYFKEVLANLTDLLQEDQYFKRYKELKDKLRTFLREENMTQTEFEQFNPSAWKEFNRAQLEWFTRQAHIETVAFARLPGAKDPNIAKDVPEVQVKLGSKGFNTRTWPERLDNLVSDLLMHSRTGSSSVEQDNLVCEWFVANRDNLERRVPEPDEIWIKSARIADTLCTLTTPLLPRQAWGPITPIQEPPTIQLAESTFQVDQ